MAKPVGHTDYSIAAVSKLTGVSCHALRVWERRYGFPVPLRSASGHRRYAHEQVVQLRSLANLARSGHSIGELIAAYLSGKLDLKETDGSKVEQRSPAAQVVDRLFQGEMASADLLLDGYSDELTTAELLEQVIEPALVDVGERWFRGECDLFQEHGAIFILYCRLVQLLARARRENAHPHHSVLVGTVQGDRHEGGVLMLSLILELAGWRAVMLGVDLPVEEYQKAIDRWHPAAVGLSFVLSRNINKRFQELAKIQSVPVFVGGRSIVNHQGLARRHGLIPLIGSLKASAAQLIAEVEAWEQRRSRASSP
jgi:MerR family transcriptional regulator, light-induced transcriptional regulator